MTEVHKMSASLPVSRWQLLDTGVVEPTPQERAEQERRTAEWRREKERRDAVREIARQALAKLTDPLSRIVLDLHSKSEGGWCEGDDLDGHDFDPPEWPCRTVRAVAAYHGIELGDW